VVGKIGRDTRAGVSTGGFVCRVSAGFLQGPAGFRACK
jgi:hypothetical protein